LKTTFISDTHGFHNKLQGLEGDMIIHAGDVSSKGTKAQVEDFLNWFKNLSFKYKIFIDGNHDFFFEEAIALELKNILPDKVIYLNDSGVEIEGKKIWGSPIQPWFHDWAFNRQRGQEIKKHWNLIPIDTDILITHGPPLDILDSTIYGSNVGCQDLLDKVKHVKPDIHVFGHIHEAYGTKELNGTNFINASVLDVKYNQTNDPIILNL